MLSQLRSAGILDAVSGVVVGSFCRPGHPDEKELDRVVREYLWAFKVPVLWKFPVGHNAANATLPHGGMFELDADAGTLRLTEDPVRPD